MSEDHEEQPAVLRIDRRGGALWLTLDRPARLNALSAGLLNAVADAVTAAAADDTVRVIVLTGAGRAFSSGGDLAEPRRPAGTEPDLSAVDGVSRVVLALRASPQPVLAAVNGPAAGAGCSIALAADLVIARESAYFVLSFASVGLMPDGGATAQVPALIGRMRAARMALLAERVPAPVALDWGLISQVAADAEFDEQVEACAAQLASGPTLAYARIKQAFNRDAGPRLREALAEEREGQAACLASADFAAGRRAFADRQRPDFTGH